MSDWETGTEKEWPFLVIVYDDDIILTGDGNKAVDKYVEALVKDCKDINLQISNKRKICCM